MDLISKCKNFKTMIKTTTVPLFGAHDGITARAIATKNFPGCYLSGAAITASYGVPDIGLLTLDHFANKIKELSLSSGLPIIADADTGFGEGEMVRRTVYDYYLAGACGFHIEDQVFPKRCGHLDGKSLIPMEDMVKKVEIAVSASEEVSKGNFIICARTDAKGVEGMDKAIERALAYLDAGAHMIFPEGLKDEAEFKLFAESIRKEHKDALLLANMTEFGKTAYINFDKFEALGYNIVIYPVSTLRVSMRAVDEFLEEFKKDLNVEPQLYKMRTRVELYDSLKYKPGKEYEYPSSITDFNYKN